MKLKYIARLIVCASVAIIVGVASAHAEEARPWLCRDKPVFSYDRPMTYQLSARAGRQWQVFFMQFDPDSAHDGFEITQSRQLGLRGAQESGKLPPGRYFTVAMYRQSGGVWVCHKYSREAPMKQGVVANLCYGESAPACLVTLNIVADQPLASPAAP